MYGRPGEEDAALAAVISSAIDYKKFLDRRKAAIALQVEQAQEAEKRGPARGEDVRDDDLDDEVAEVMRDPMRDPLRGALRDPPRLAEDRGDTAERSGTPHDPFARRTTASPAPHRPPRRVLDPNWTPGRERPGSTGTAHAHAQAHARLTARGPEMPTPRVGTPREAPRAQTPSGTPRAETPSGRAEAQKYDDADAPLARSDRSLDDYIIGKQVGQGAYATVRFGMQKENGTKVAIKIYEKYKLLDPQRRKSVWREIKLMERLNHPNVVKFVDAVDTVKQVCIVMEFLGGGSLHHYLKKRPTRRLEDSRARRIFVQMCAGLKYLHDRYIVHRDIKLENLLLDENATVKLIDFGFSTVVPPGKKIKVFCGTPSYMAPEIVARKEYPGPCADIWASGVLLYALLCGCFPFKGANDRDLYRKIMKGMFFIPDVPVSAGARALLNKLLTVDMYRRPTIADMLADSWVTTSGAEEKPARVHQTSISSATTATSSQKANSGTLLPQDEGATSGGLWTDLAGGSRPGSRPGGWRPSTAAEIPAEAEELPVEVLPPEDEPPAEVKPFEFEEEAVAKLERLGYGREEILRQLQEEGSHLYKLYFRFLKALNAWGAK